MRVITDHQYNRPRPTDDQQPNDFALLKQHQYLRDRPERHDADPRRRELPPRRQRRRVRTQLITQREPVVHRQRRSSRSGTRTRTTTRRSPARSPRSVDATQHIDMWMQIYDDNKVFISDWPNNVGIDAGRRSATPPRR